MRRLAFYLGIAVLAGCAGYRGGWESIPYIGDNVPVGTEVSTRSDAPDFILPGLKMRVRMDNRLRTYDTQVYFFVLPLSIDPREAYPQNHQPGKTRVYVSVTPEDGEFVFMPRKASLSIGDRRFAGEEGFEFGMWDQSGKRVTQGGRWAHRPLGSELALIEAGREYLLSIDFPTPAPSPDLREIALDLSQALTSKGHPPIPLIRFAPVRWKEGYT